jgi:sugar lactone lactonase YvrE
MGMFIPPPTAASLCGPSDVTVDSDGNVYIADLDNNRVVEYDNPLATDTVADRVFGHFGSFTDLYCNTTGNAGADTLCHPGAVALDNSGNLYVADTNNSRVLVFENPLATDTVADKVFGQSDFTSRFCNAGAGYDHATANTLCFPSGVAVDGAGALYIADNTNQRVLQFDSPLATDAVPDRVFGQQGSFTSSACNGTGSPADPPTARTLCVPTSAATDSFGNLYVADSQNNRVLMYSAAPLPTPGGIAVAVGGVVGLPADTTGSFGHSRSGDTRNPIVASLVAVGAGIAGSAIFGAYLRWRRQ